MKFAPHWTCPRKIIINRHNKNILLQTTNHFTHMLVLKNIKAKHVHGIQVVLNEENKEK